MFSFLSKILQKNLIDCFAPIPLSACRIIKPYLLERAGIRSGTVVMLAVPYYTAACTDANRNLSAYAISRDYHGFFKALFEDILLQLQQKFPSNRFACFADHSPIAEIDAAARAGLGVIGMNGLLLTPKYSSYVFLGEIITDAVIECKAATEIAFCEKCNRCLKYCPQTETGICLSALTQKKGDLTQNESDQLQRHPLVWGCDICQEVCPHTQKALSTGSIFTPIPYFKQSTLSNLTPKILDDMSEEKFAERAYAWRGKETIRRNLLLKCKEKAEKGDGKC